MGNRSLMIWDNATHSEFIVLKVISVFSLDTQCRGQPPRVI